MKLKGLGEGDSAHLSHAQPRSGGAIMALDLPNRVAENIAHFTGVAWMHESMLAML